MFARGAEAGHLPLSDDPIGDIIVHVAEVLVGAVAVDVAWPTFGRRERALVGPLKRKGRGQLLVRHAAALVVVGMGGPIFRSQQGGEQEGQDKCRSVHCCWEVCVAVDPRRQASATRF